jgi:glycosyltransferase involved in cell wall biosynthesis
LRVLLLTDADVFAGTERHMLDLAVGLSAAGVHPLIGCPADTPLAEHARAAGLGHLPVEKHRAIDRLAVGVMRRLLRDGEVDLIHAHNGRTALNAAVARSLARRGRVVMTQHFIAPTRTTRQGDKRLVSDVAHRWMSRRIDHSIAISTSVREAMLLRGDCEPDRVTVVHNGIVDACDAGIVPAATVRRSLDVPADARLVVCAARLQPEKDVSVRTSIASSRAEVISSRCYRGGSKPSP